MDKALSWLLIKLIRGYQIALSPIMGRQCRFHPTCSHYGIEAIQVHGAIKGTALTIWRILRCNPFCEGGEDPVPPTKHQKQQHNKHKSCSHCDSQKQEQINKGQENE